VGVFQECEFILTESGDYYVQRPTSVFGGMARDRWLREHWGRDAVIHIASPSVWQRLVSENDVQRLSLTTVSDGEDPSNGGCR
jgi:hypothetical protein